jgi:hypothetical protein
VLIVDWDLEAPGLHRYFHPFLLDKDLTSTRGLIDLVWDFATEAMTPVQPDELKKGWHEKHANILRYAIAVRWRFSNEKGRIDLLPAGKQGLSYGSRVNSFNWQNFYERLGGGVFLETVKEKMREHYDYILIDSRTGVSDTSGICTVQMPDMLVVFYTANTQSIDGAAAVAASVHEQWALPRKDQLESAALHRRRIFPVMTRVELGEKDKLDLARNYARSKFDRVLDHMSVSANAEYWAGVETLYVPWYAYEEVLATFGDKTNESNSLLASAEKLTAFLTDGLVSKLDPPKDSDRAKVLQQFSRGPTSTVMEEQAAYDVYISYSRNDLEWVRNELLPGLRQAGLKTFIDVENVRAGDRLDDVLSQALQQSRQVVAVMSPAWAESELAQQEVNAVIQPDHKNIKLVPILLETCEVPVGLRGILYADFTNPSNRAKAMQGLLRSLGAEIKTVSPLRSGFRRAFVSHNIADDSYVAEMESFLRAAGYDDVFNDASAIRPDEKFWPRVEEGITNADTLVVVITAASNTSEWMKREFEFARSLSKKIIPVWVEDCPIPAMFADRDVIDFRPRTRVERRFDISRIVKYAPAELIGREDETKLLNDAWDKLVRSDEGRPRIITFVALGGEGKTSLVAKWAADLAQQDWPGCDAAFAWSFYSQGTREQVAASSDLFLKEALTFFGDDADQQFAASNAGAFEKGQRLARLVGHQRSLLILDGLEPLQFAPTSPTPGQLKDQGIAAVLKGLAAASRGLCIVTTRYSIPNLKAFWQTTASEVKLQRLSRDAGVVLLKTLGVRGTAQEFTTLVEDVKGHALTLTLLGSFLKRAFHGDIRKRDLVKLEKADEKMDGGQAFRTVAALEQWLLRDGGDEGRREVAVLRLMGLFDRPADAGCLAALRSETIPGLTEPLAGLADDDWEFCLSGLEAAKLLTVNRDAAGAVVSLNAHPLLREYFARQLRTQQLDAWRAAHRRLYEHLCATTKEGEQPTLEDLQPLYQAVAHGCLAELRQEVCDKVYLGRILRGNENYSVSKLGAFVRDLGAVACFFESPWTRVSSRLDESTQTWVLNRAALYLRALGRLAEALEPMRAGVERVVRLQDWNSAARYASNLSELELTLGEVTGAVGDAERSVNYADRSGDAFQRLSKRCTHADALHQAGRQAAPETRFREAEQMQKEGQPDYPLLYSLAGFRYCDLLLAAPERAAWQQILSPNSQPSTLNLADSCRAVSQRAVQTLKWAELNNVAILDIALDHLTLGRAALYAAILESSRSDFGVSRSELDAAVTGLRRAGDQDFLPYGLLTRAWCSFADASFFAKATKDESADKLRGDTQEAVRLFSCAQEDLDEAWEIAERGPMKLFMADIHLYRARLFGNRKADSGDRKEGTAYPWESPAADLVAAEKLINDCGYHRRDEELADAKAVLVAT